MFQVVQNMKLTQRKSYQTKYRTNDALGQNNDNILCTRITNKNTFYNSGFLTCLV